jgi:hypothetical protein
MAHALTVEFGDGVVNALIQIVGGGEGLMSQLMTLQITPNSLDIIEFGGVFWQPLDGQPVRPCRQGCRGCLAGMDRTVVENQHGWLAHRAWPGAVEAIDLLQQRDEVRAALGPAGVYDQLTSGPVEYAKHRDFGGLSGGWHSQVGPSPGPDVSEVGVCQSLRFIAEQQRDVARLGLRFQQFAAQATTIHRVGILAALQRVTRPAPAKLALLAQHHRQSRTRQSHPATPLDLIAQPRQRPVRPVRHRHRQNLRCHFKGAGGFDRRRSPRGAGPQCRDALPHKRHPPQSNGILSDPERFSDTRSRPPGQCQQDRACPIGFAAIPRLRQLPQQASLLRVGTDR